MRVSIRSLSANTLCSWCIRGRWANAPLSRGKRLTLCFALAASISVELSSHTHCQGAKREREREREREGKTRGDEGFLDLRCTASANVHSPARYRYLHVSIEYMSSAYTCFFMHSCELICAGSAQNVPCFTSLGCNDATGGVGNLATITDCCGMIDTLTYRPTEDSESCLSCYG